MYLYSPHPILGMFHCSSSPNLSLNSIWNYSLFLRAGTLPVGISTKVEDGFYNCSTWYAAPLGLTTCFLSFFSFRQIKIGICCVVIFFVGCGSWFFSSSLLLPLFLITLSYLSFMIIQWVLALFNIPVLCWMCALHWISVIASQSKFWMLLFHWSLYVNEKKELCHKLKWQNL